MPVDNLIGVLRDNQAFFSPVRPFDPVKEKLILPDFTENNRQLTGDIIADTVLFGQYIDEPLPGESR